MDKPIKPPFSLKQPNLEFTYVVTSDIHLGHDRTPTAHVIESFTSNILTEENKHIDVLFINGDLFDQPLKLNSDPAQIIIQFLHRLLDYCYFNQIKLRVLEGTPSHDWFQSSTIVRLNDVRRKKVDLVYHRSLDIEYFPEYQKHVLYIPDEWCSSQESLEQQVNQKLQEYNISKVDIAMLHGQFKYQVLYQKTHAFSYDETYFHDLVKGFIHIGHFHSHTNFDRIIANGSLERLAHGEEEDKGYLRVTGRNWVFVPNSHAYIYKTIKVTPKTDIPKLDKLIFRFPKQSYIRLQIPSSHELYETYKDLQLRYIDYHLTRKKEEVSDGRTNTYIESADELLRASHTFTEINIYDALCQAVTTKHSLTPKEHKKFLGFAEIFIKSSISTDTLKAV